MNRCIAYNKNNNKCRAKTKNNMLFCCKDHEPLNNDLIENGCFICCEKINNSNEIIYFKCKHAFHKPCYIEWLSSYSTYEKSICIICRNEVLDNNLKEKNKKKYVKIDIINSNILLINKIFSKNNDIYNIQSNNIFLNKLNNVD
jgi:hypothetical protein